MNGYDVPRGTQKASKIADCLRCNFLPECYMASTEVRERHRTLRYRELLVRQNVQLRYKVSQHSETIYRSAGVL
jgi:hypothetical protein